MLKREEITEARIEKVIEEARRFGKFDALTQEEREENRKHFLGRLKPGEDLWLFGYGSLIWNAAFDFSEKKKARLYGYRRRFCLHLTIGRGSAEKPGLMLALDLGGSCNGLAFRIEADKIESETKVLWMREMISGAYMPRWVSLKTEQGSITGFTFIVNRGHSRYRNNLSLEETAAGLIRGKGQLGTCREYLFNTVQHLENLGIRDGYLSRLQEAVLKQMGRSR